MGEIKKVAGAPDFAWDSRADLAEREGHIRDTILYTTTGLLGWMEAEWGQMVQWVKTATNVETSEVMVAKASKDDADAVPLKRVGTQNSAYISFLVPLRKMNIKVPEDRQFNVKPSTREVPDVGTVFIFDMKERVSVPRNLKEDEEIQQGEVQDKAAVAKQP